MDTNTEMMLYLATNRWFWRVVIPSRFFPELSHLNEPVVVAGLAATYIAACSAINTIRYSQYATRISIRFRG